MLESLLGCAYAFDWPSRLPLRTAVERIDVELEAPALDGGTRLKLGFASDLHAGPTTSRRTLEEAFDHLRDFDPDVLLLGGDFVLFEARHAERLGPLIRSVRAPYGRFAVLGNHDLWADDRKIVRTLERAGVEVLINRIVRLPALRLSIAGFDDAWTGAPRYEEAISPRAPIHVVLMHSPDHVPRLPAELSFTLALCGHTHGGQVSLPTGAPIVTPSAASRRFASGRFELPGGPLWVSRGVGNVEVPFRAFAAPDVLCISLISTARTS